MRKLRIPFILFCVCLALACSPRDFLTRRLAAELIANSDAFKATQRFWLRTGAISNKDHLSPEYLVLQQRGWINSTNMPCPADIAPPPCWDIVLTPLGVDTFRPLMANNATPSSYFSVPAARRQLISVSGISKDEQLAEVDFVWKWVPMNEVGTALYGNGVEYTTTAGFRHYDDGWRVIEGTQPKRYPAIDDALKASEPKQ
jgi:hypothetical protein